MTTVGESPRIESTIDPDRAISKPYKGPHSYQVEDADFFFGREEDGSRLIATVLSFRLSILHAVSGTGKTSLLNARLIPGLEARGWTPVRVLPETDPVASTRLSTVRHLLPPPDVELDAINHAATSMFPGADPTLRDLLTAFDALEPRDPIVRSLLRPRQTSWDTRPAGLPPLGWTTPVFSRLLRSSTVVEEFADHLNVLGAWQESPYEPVVETTRVSAVTERLSDNEFQQSYDTLLSYANAPVPGLVPFFSNIGRLYRSGTRPLAFVLVFDQFEEMFTRFDTPSMRALVSEFFDEFEQLFRNSARSDPVAEPPGAADPDVTLPPMRYLVSLRDEWLAPLIDRVRAFVPNPGSSAYHLRLLNRKQAESAIKEPARLYGYRYSQDCYESIMAELVKDDGHESVEPTHVQLVCERLWSARGAELVAVGSQPAADLPTIEIDTFVGLGGARGILDSFLHEYLATLEAEERREALDILDQLILPSKFARNIVERSAVVHAPCRNPERRERLLRALENHAIVRVEQRLGGSFVEITHEFLIQPIRDAIEKEHRSSRDFARFRNLLRVLERFQRLDFHEEPERLLGQRDFAFAEECRSRIWWDAWSSELMLRSAILLGADPETVSHWLARFQDAHVGVDRGGVLANVLSMTPLSQTLSRSELAAVNAERDALDLDVARVELILRGEISMASAAEQEDVRYWTGRYVTHAQ